MKTMEIKAYLLSELQDESAKIHALTHIKWLLEDTEAKLQDDVIDKWREKLSGNYGCKGVHIAYSFPNPNKLVKIEVDNPCIISADTLNALSKCIYSDLENCITKQDFTEYSDEHGIYYTVDGHVIIQEQGGKNMDTGRKGDNK